MQVYYYNLSKIMRHSTHITTAVFPHYFSQPSVISHINWPLQNRNAIIVLPCKRRGQPLDIHAPCRQHICYLMTSILIRSIRYLAVTYLFEIGVYRLTNLTRD